MRAELLFILLRSLARARGLKREMRRSRRGPCFLHAEHCSCARDELCNLALAQVLGRDSSNVLKQMRRAQQLLPGAILSRRIIDAPAIYPRRYYRLAGGWAQALIRAVLGEKKEEA